MKCLFCSAPLAVLFILVMNFSSCGTSKYKLILVREGNSIQEAIDKASPYDTIFVHDGIYYENISINKPLVIKAVNPGEVSITNMYRGTQKWEKAKGEQLWVMPDVDWPVHWLLVDGVHAFDYRHKENFDKQVCGPYWSKGWQEGESYYPNPPFSFAWDSLHRQIWLRLDDERNPNDLAIHFNSDRLNDTTLVQKDLGAYWNQQQIVAVSKNPSEYPVTMWYEGTPDNPSAPRYMFIPRICGIAVDINSNEVTLDGLRIHLAPTVAIEVNNSKNVTIRNCYLSGYQFGINTGYECTNLEVTHCEFDGGSLVSKGNHTSVFLNMWNHNTYAVPVKFNGTGLVFRHNYVYEGFDLFQPRGRHKDFPDVPDLMSDVAFNVWQQAIDNNLEFDGVEALISMRFHHNLVLGRGSNDMLAITTTENGNPLLIDHNLFLNGGDDSRIMKLVGTRRTNDGVKFIHNTYFTGSHCSYAPFGPRSTFDNNIIVSECERPGCWADSTLGYFFPTEYNIAPGGGDYMTNFNGITDDPLLGKEPDNYFTLMANSPAIDAGRELSGYFNNDFAGSAPDLGALEYGTGIGEWREKFGHCGPEWINSSNAAEKAPNRPEWPSEIDVRWGGLE